MTMMMHLYNFSRIRSLRTTSYSGNVAVPVCRFSFRLMPGIGLLGALCLTGCGHEPAAPQAEIPIAVPAATSISQTPLTREEISKFLSVVQKLPDQQPPEFVESDLPRLASAEQIDRAVEHMRSSIRRAVTPERQAAEWSQLLPLKHAFAEMNVDPVEFANLMLKISCAWSAWQIGQETTLPDAREQLDLRTSQLIEQAQQLPEGVSALERRELLDLLEELVVLTEFLQLLEQVPAESLPAVAAAQAELRRVLPASSLREEFSRYLGQQSRILRTGYSAP